MISQERLISLYDQYANRMYRLALSYLKSIPDAEDVVQTIFTKLIEKDMTILPGKEQALLLQMTVNQCKDLLRAFRRRRTEPLEEQILFAESQDRELFQLVMALADKYRIPLYLHYYEGCTIDEIAALLRISPSAVSMRLTRGRKMLKTELEV